MLTDTSRWSHARGNEVVPSRWQATTRCYSAADLALIRRRGDLVADGVNLAGVAHILAPQSP